MPYRRTPAVQARLDGQRAALVAAATQLIAEGGYAACGVAAVASRAQVATGTVYRHFPSKNALAEEVFRTVVGGEVAAVRAAVDRASGVGDKIAAVVETFAGRALKSPRLAYALLAEPVDPAVDELRLEFRVAFREIAAEAISDAVAAGEIPPQDPALAAAALVGAIADALVRPLGAAAGDPDTISSLVTFVHRALGVVDAAYA